MVRAPSSDAGPRALPLPLAQSYQIIFAPTNQLLHDFARFAMTAVVQHADAKPTGLPAPVQERWDPMQGQHSASLTDQQIADAAYFTQAAQQQRQQQEWQQQQELAQARRISDSNEDTPQSGHRPRVPIPPQRSSVASSSDVSPTSTSEQMSPGHDQAIIAKASGPMSSNVIVRARPKPGRKPIPQEDAADRRRLQNRIAQRNFRDKRQQKLLEATEELQNKRTEYEGSISDLQRQLEAQKQDFQRQMESQRQEFQRQIQSNRQVIDDLRHENQVLQERLVAAEERAVQAESQSKLLRTQQWSLSSRRQAPHGLHSFRPAPLSTTANHPPSGEPTPPSDGYEVDFTNYGRATQHYGLHHTASNESNRMDYSMGQDEDRCGFCTDDSNCTCRQKAEPIAPNNEGPGNCDACRADPQKAQACRDMAAETQRSAAPGASSQPSEPLTAGGVSTTMPPPRMSCSAMIDHFTRYGERPSTISTLFGGRMNTHPSAAGGYEFEETEAAEVLSNLARRSKPAESPKQHDEDEHANARNDSLRS